MQSKKRSWWLLGLPIIACLPCVLPAIAAVFLAAGGAGALGSFFAGAAGPLALGGGAALLGMGAVSYLRWKSGRQPTASECCPTTIEPQVAGPRGKRQA